MYKSVSSKCTIHCNVSKVSYHQYSSHDETISGTCELDSHSDTCVAGSNCTILETTNKTVSVRTVSDTHEVLHDIPIVTAATAYDDPNTGTMYILILGQSIYMGDRMENSLICPSQLRTNGAIIDDCPEHLAPPDKPSTHSIYLPDDDLYLPLSLQGVTSSFLKRTPMIEEIETCKWVTLSNEHEWDPHSTHFREQEDNYLALQQGHYQPGDRHIYATSSQSHKTCNYRRFDTLYGQISTAFDDTFFLPLIPPNENQTEQQKL
jgi:hypothetical protein